MFLSLMFLSPAICLCLYLKIKIKTTKHKPTPPYPHVRIKKQKRQEEGSHETGFFLPVTFLSFLPQEFLLNGLFKEATTPTSSFSFSRNLTFEINFKNICLCRRNTFIWTGWVF